MKLSDHFTLDEATFSQTALREGVDNSPSPEILKNLQLTALSLEIARTVLLSNPIIVTSWYRSPEVNKLVKGSKDSQHMTGEAVDFICPAYGSPFTVCLRLREFKNVLRYDQLIYEGTWVHISFNAIPTRNPRGQELTWMRDKSYQQGFLEER